MATAFVITCPTGKAVLFSDRAPGMKDFRALNLLTTPIMTRNVGLDGHALKNAHQAPTFYLFEPTGGNGSGVPFVSVSTLESKGWRTADHTTGYFSAKIPLVEQLLTASLAK